MNRNYQLASVCCLCVIACLSQQDAQSTVESGVVDLLISPDLQHSDNQLLQFAKISLTEKEAKIFRKILVVDQVIKTRQEMNGRRTSSDAPITLQIPYTENSTRVVVNSLEFPIEKLSFFDLKQQRLEMDRVRRQVQANPFAIVVTSPTQIQPSLGEFFKNEMLYIVLPKELATETKERDENKGSGLNGIKKL